MRKEPKLEEVFVEAFVLRDCVFGKAGEIVSLQEIEAKTGKEQGMLDLEAEAIEAHRA